MLNFVYNPEGEDLRTLLEQTVQIQRNYRLPILKTKLYIPRPQADMVVRPRLNRILSRLNQANLCLVSAPTGFGKTTLLSGWAKELQQQDLSLSWLSLDKADNDPILFWTYLISSLQTQFPEMGQQAISLFNQLETFSVESALVSLINDIAQEKQHIFLVLDDFHAIETDQIHQQLCFLLDNVPENFHLIISTRMDPPLNLSRLRANNGLVEVRTAQLRFTSDEINEYITKISGQELSPEILEKLEDRSEGWIVGLRLAILSLDGSDDQQNYSNKLFESSDFVFDYLIEEVLNKQSKKVKNFLIRTAVLDRMSGPLCEALLGEKVADRTGQIMLQQLEQRNLFIIPLDDEHCWYRYHHLFAKMLRKYSRQVHPDLQADLHYHAADWFKQNGFFREAISHFLDARAWDEAAEMVQSMTWKIISASGQWATIRHWIDQLPREVIQKYPRLMVHYAFAQLSQGDIAMAQNNLGLAEVWLRAQQNEQGLGELFTIKAYLHQYQSDSDKMIEYANQALLRLPADDFNLRSLALSSLAHGHHLNGQIKEAELALAQALKLGQIAGSSLAENTTKNLFGMIYLSRGDLRQAARSFKLVLADHDLKSKYAPTTTAYEACFQLGKIYYEWNDLENAIKYLKIGIEICETMGSLKHASYGYVKLAHALLTAKAIQEANEAIEMAEATSRQLDTESRIKRSLAYKAWLDLRQSNLDQAKIWLDNFEKRIYLGSLFDRQNESLVAARIYLFENQPEKVISLLKPLTELARVNHRNGHLYELLALQALAFQAVKQTDQALAYLKESLEMTMSAGYLRSYLDEGQPMAELFRLLEQQGYASAYTAQVLSIFENERPEDLVSYSKEGQVPVFKVDDDFMIEELTEREIEVLQLVESVYSNRDIAHELLISVGTVKRHLHNIYIKLNVGNRREAIEKARTFGLL
jgi:LuxR family maltose regulon positive regulatory protein